MIVCDTVTNSVWFDPRVIKQIDQYSTYDGVELHIVGKKCPMYKKEEVDRLPGHVVLVDRPKRIFRSIFINLVDFWTMSRAIIRTNADIIHANDLDALVPAYIAARKLGCKLIYDTHEIFLQNNWIFDNWLFRHFWHFFESRIIKKVDLVVCVSNAAADYLKDYYKIPRPLVVTNCVSEHQIYNGQDKHDGFEVLMHGKFYKGRGYDLMVQAAALNNNPNIKYVFRGFGSMEKELRDFVADNHVENVVFYPPVKTRELLSSASASHIGVAITVPYCLNFKLSVSNKIFEYLGAGLPVIMSDIPEHRYLNEKYHIGIILDELSPECLNSAVEKLYEDKSFYTECVINAKRISHELSWETEFNKLYQAEIQMLK
jgi:glycosyltransferase involved in cell wall biosynthesis